ncbi:M56 family metallopeptidase [Elizabethkingia meningoseptica]|uniref:M56 family metallopeptidase n=1 Tax=Elizabethkingia meningoseptica TaxID=238 RepID=UPI002DD62475|nr:M56 family metallopeptidase [Elizabethkingia meningoseptica]MEC4710159.1 M56 family metallopeptidase [Elizabethkingia meningoseptica]
MDSSKIILLLAISGLLCLVYKLILANHKIFTFNRFFLIGSVVLSLVIPFIQIDVARENNPVRHAVNIYQIQEVIISKSTPSFNWFSILSNLYLIITAIFIIRFIFGVVQLAYRVYKNEKRTVNGIHYVLLPQQQIPYCFFNYIFVSGEEFLNRNIEPEILQHEYAHLYQKHTLDVLFMQLVLAFAWFNPFFWFLKRAIISNHEFLADEYTLHLSKDIKHYRELIINKTLAPFHNQFASNFNFLLTKKRFIMMTKHTPKNKVRLLKLSGSILFIAATAFGIGLNAREKQSITSKIKSGLEQIPIVQAITSPVKADTTKQERKAIIAQKLTELNRETAEKRAQILNKYSKSGELKNSDFPPAPPTPPTPPNAPAAPPAPPVPPTPPYAKTEGEATFSGGINEFRDMFMQYFDNSKVDGTGTLKSVASLIIDKEGNVKKITATGSNEKLNAEVKRTIETINTHKKWIPAQVKGENVESQFRFPITMNFEGMKKS